MLVDNLLDVLHRLRRRLDQYWPLYNYRALYNNLAHRRRHILRGLHVLGGGLHVLGSGRVHLGRLAHELGA